ncbi:uncharacterized protein LOC101461013 isoform X2 [Ceratitis capitata]|uniref:uncharacterized protein LOC101461013 isoform X2 n=1 Tax=Ceratitis capitata TaxID=7213 RepID=UPI000A0F7590|nr:uncharacterized protein LOC101461013 isoform X2 [Ceratitis capitata]
MTGHRALEDSDLALISRVKVTPSLYDPRNPDFRLAYRKEQEWEIVGSMVGMTASEARRRWTCLRDRYSRELKQLRLHPEKNEYGNNPFFRQMDFLRRYVRKRRNRRRNGFIEFENQFASIQKQNNEENTVQYQNRADITEVDEEDDYNLENYDGQSDTYASKVDDTTMESNDYPEFVDGEEVYEECVETPNSEGKGHQSTSNASINVGTKPINATIMPINMPQQNVNRTVYTISSGQTHHNAPTTKSDTAPSSHSTAYKQQQNHSSYATLQYRSPHDIKTPSPPHVYSNQTVAETEDDLFGKSIAVYLKQLSRRHKIKAQVEMFQILEKYIELEESAKTRILNINEMNTKNG